MKVHNFSAGPSILPPSVFQEAAAAVLNYNNTGLSILEMSHRSPEIMDVMATAQQKVLDLLALSNTDYEVLFLQGGASTQFLMVAQNFLNTKAAYLNTGTWATKAIKEAHFFGELLEVASSKDKNFSYIPKNYTIPETADYFHCTSNNTIFGTQIQKFPDTNVPIACDMSSDIFSRTLDFSKFSIIYAGAQKNLGPAGTTLVVLKKDMLSRITRQIPSMLDYSVHTSKGSMFNTPPVFAIYVALCTLNWVETQGGVSALEKRNTQKAQLMYSEIDRNPLFEGFVENIEDRSSMNATFNIKSQTLKPRFDMLCKEASISGLNGHRSVGGYRASMYNAMPKESVQVLVDVMQHLETTA